MPETFGRVPRRGRAARGGAGRARRPSEIRGIVGPGRACFSTTLTSQTCLIDVAACCQYPDLVVQLGSSVGRGEQDVQAVGAGIAGEVGVGEGDQDREVAVGPPHKHAAVDGELLAV